MHLGEKIFKTTGTKTGQKRKFACGHLLSYSDVSSHSDRIEKRGFK